METPPTPRQHERLEYQQGALLLYDANIDFGGIHPKDLVRAMEKQSAL
jgi:hypothetical protein